MTDRETWAEQRERLEWMASGEEAGPVLGSYHPSAVRAALERIDALEAVAEAAGLAHRSTCNLYDEGGFDACRQCAAGRDLSSALARFDALRGGDKP